MAVDYDALHAAVVSHAQKLGVFDSVTDEEPVSAPGPGLAAGCWFLNVLPARLSGLAATSAVIQMRVRILTPASTTREGGPTDRRILAAADLLLDAYTGDFQLTDAATVSTRMIDLLASSGGGGLFCQLGWLEVDERTYRMAEITVPILVNDAWAQSP